MAELNSSYGCGVMDKRKKKFGFYEFFAGAGLAGLGLGDQWACLWANDIDPRKGEVFVKNFGNHSLRIDDISNVRAAELPERADLAWASFPCQDLSLAGWRRGMTAKHSGAFWEFWRIIHELTAENRNPRIIAIENVVGLLYGDSLVGLSEALTSLGYRFGAVIIDAKHFLPQSRARVFIIAVSGEIDLSGLTLSEVPAKPTIWHSKKLLQTVGAFSDDLKKNWIWWNLPAPEKSSISLAKVVTEPDAYDPSWFSDDEVSRLMTLMSDRHREKVLEAAEDIGNGTPKVFTVYKRIRQGEQKAEVRSDDISGCLRVPGGGSSRQIIIVVKNGRIKARLMNRRELGRLMGVPDTFWLPEKYNNAYRAMGDAVVVPAVRWLADNIITPLARQTYDRVSDKSIISSLDRADAGTYLNRSRRRMEEWKRNGV